MFSFSSTTLTARKELMSLLIISRHPLNSSLELITQLFVAKHRKYIRRRFNKLETKNRRISKIGYGFQNGLK
jgi:hypothetical protein